MNRERGWRQRAARGRDVVVNRERVRWTILFQSRERENCAVRQTAGVLLNQLGSELLKFVQSSELGAGSLELGASSLPFSLFGFTRVLLSFGFFCGDRRIEQQRPQFVNGLSRA